MKRIYLTGITGTVAPYLKENLIQKGFEVIDTHIRINDLSDIQTSLNEIEKAHVSMIFHLALGPIEWTKALVSFAVTQNIKFVYVSTVSVFEDNQGGPYKVNDLVHVSNEYGKYKYESEQVIKSIDPSAYIIRIGWQIDPKGNVHTNNMFQFFDQQIQSTGSIQVSDQFYPSCSFINDTVEAIANIALTMTPDLYFINGNHRWSLYDIAKKINSKYHLNWHIEKTSFSRNDIMLDPRVMVPFDLN